jgi:hypothetical protein
VDSCLRKSGAINSGRYAEFDVTMSAPKGQ